MCGDFKLLDDDDDDDGEGNEIFIGEKEAQFTRCADSSHENRYRYAACVDIPAVKRSSRRFSLLMYIFDDLLHDDDDDDGEE